MGFGDGLVDEEAGRAFGVTGERAAGEGPLRRHLVGPRADIVDKAHDPAAAHIPFGGETEEGEEIVVDHRLLEAGAHLVFVQFALVEISLHEGLVVTGDGFDQFEVQPRGPLLFLFGDGRLFRFAAPGRGSGSRPCAAGR